MLKRTLTIRIRNRIQALPISEVLYLEKMGRRVLVHTSEIDHVFYSSFDDIMKELDRRFSRFHRSYILNLERIANLEGQRVEMDDATELFFGKRTIQRLRREYETYLEWKKERLRKIGHFMEKKPSAFEFSQVKNCNKQSKPNQNISHVRA